MDIETYDRALKTKDYYEFADCFAEGCSRCTLAEHGSGPILYRGNPKADIMLIGEAPGMIEERMGRTFVGPAGELLDKIFSAIGLDTNVDLFITNCVFCRPTAPAGSGKQNYTPKKEQIARCWPFVEKTIELVNPKILIACGRPALCTLMGDPKMKMGKWEGRWLVHKSTKKLFVMTHPAAVLHLAKWPEDQQLAKEKIWGYMQYFRDTWKGKC